MAGALHPKHGESTTTVSDEAKALALRWGVKFLLVVGFAASVWWARTGADEYTGPAKPPRPTENFSASSTYVSSFAQRENMLAPGFRAMRVVHELLIISDLYAGPRGQRLGGGYIDPAVMAEPTVGEGRLPDVFAESPRAGYHFEFIGSDPTIHYETAVIPYRSFVYIASPESDAVSQYTFALYSEDSQVHYTTEARVPTMLDPAVTDGAAPVESEAPAEVTTKKPGLLSRMSAWGARLRRRFSTSGNDVARAEARAIDDLRTFAAAQNTFFLMLGARGYASVEALIDPGSLEGVPDMTPFVDQEFIEQERDGYRYTFTGERLTNAGQPWVYRDYSYVALPVGLGTPDRRSFAIYSDNVVRVRTDGTAPLLIDPPVNR